MLAPPGMKPDGAGGFKVAGEHPKTYVLEHDTGAKCTIKTEDLSVISWKTPAGKELMGGDDSVALCFPDETKKCVGHFVPEERAKKVSFDRMIFKCSPKDGDLDINAEFRVDVTMREDSLEYDVIVMNLDSKPLDNISTGIKFKLQNGAKLSKVTGYKNKSDTEVSTGKWSAPVGKFKEHAFYVKFDAPK